MKLDISLNNADLYQGVAIHEAGGRLAIDLSDDVLNQIGRNAGDLMAGIEDRSEITLTGAAPIPVYLVVFHIVVHRFRKVYYDNEMYNLLIARH
ncbi:MAG: hypothetical protein DKM50_00900 [Candidatus Margulisiibacteriota bacterium]|nr:MAG: hypothetical protein A2X43_02610 [Candidatus Margulisbacteria bacterium GWD2_39_127]OGI05125.1 MAG: hypothetical protein A2X42_05620 [Candidatus Margulisbacteria bacterium GWF2_38_17]OGI11169.1 MAG: hypothetical protein A2X41_00315 [Candidatus Margulisbacteria bacterium GWE2_39_32]PZM83923.1 MAG: hypothetical protein DKM50_00900 [Candidatus Margulisiibacteriota bacterium]HAR64169.1 hypothetical protein [Candidatus Margulisiibacteriota bacterium]